MQFLKKTANKEFFIFIGLAFVFSVFCRLYWVFWASGFSDFFFNESLMIVSNDGYAFAEGARDMIAGFHQANDLSYFQSSLSTLTYYLYKITPFSFEHIILYMSVFFSSLVVVPIMLIAYEYKELKAGFIAALFASIANSYYNRTMAGYYDTDMLAIVLPLFVLYFMINLILKKSPFSLIILPFVMIFYLWYYPSSYTLNVAFVGLFFIYILIFHKKEKILYLSLIFMLIALANVAWFYQSAILALLFALFALKNEFFNKKIIILLAILSLIFLYFSGGLDPILYQLEFYIFKNDASSHNQSFNYFNVNQTIQEVGSIDLSVFMQRITASELAFLCSCLGVFLLCKKHKSFILSLAMLALGFLALRGGLRFTIYSVPIMALGFGYFVQILLAQIKNKINIKAFFAFHFIFYALAFLSLIPFILNAFFQYKNLENPSLNALNIYLFLFPFTQLAHQSLFQLFIVFLSLALALSFIKRKKKEALKVLIISVSLLISLGFALKHIYEYKASTVFNSNEAQILNELKNKASREDYVLAWWDYGYPIRYYSDVKTLVDGGKHLGKDNFFPSYALSFDQISAANIARLAVEYTERAFYEQNNSLLQNDLLKAMMKDYEMKSEILFLHSLKDKNLKLPQKTRDIYFYLPARMSPIFPTVASFSHIDLQTGRLNDAFIFSVASKLSQNNFNGTYYLSNGMFISDDYTFIIQNDRAYNFKAIYEFDSIKDFKFSKRELDKDGNFYLFYLKEGKNLAYPMQFIIMNETMFQSTFVQLFFLGNYDKDLFELSINEKDAKVFKLKK